MEDSGGGGTAGENPGGFENMRWESVLIPEVSWRSFLVTSSNARSYVRSLLEPFVAMHLVTSRIGMNWAYLDVFRWCAQLLVGLVESLALRLREHYDQMGDAGEVRCPSASVVLGQMGQEMHFLFSDNGLGISWRVLWLTQDDPSSI